MQTTPKPISTKSPRKTKNAARFLLDWAAVIVLARHVHHHCVRHRRYGYHGAGRL